MLGLHAQDERISCLKQLVYVDKPPVVHHESEFDPSLRTSDRSARSTRILLVEDAAADEETMGRASRKAGFDDACVSSCATAKAALQSCMRKRSCSGLLSAVA